MIDGSWSANRFADRFKRERSWANRSMPFIVAESTDPLVELERRQDSVLRQLDELDQRIERALREFSAVQKETAERFGLTQKAAA